VRKDGSCALREAVACTIFMLVWLVVLHCLSTQLRLVGQLPMHAPVILLPSVTDVAHGSTGHQELKAVENSNDWSRGSRKQVSWLHMHKFGGTFMTKMARLQGETFPLSSINANWMPDFCSTPRGLRVLCAERTGVSSSSSHISWSAMERELDEGDFCEDALVGTILREPLGALQSVLSHDQFDRKAILETLRNCYEAAPAKHFMYQPPADFISNASKCLPEWDTYHHFDNFATRTLGGAYMAPPCGIDRSHLEVAKNQLRRMDVVMILEELGSHLPQLKDIFRWNMTLVQPWKKINRKPGQKPKHVPENLPAQTTTPKPKIKTPPFTSEDMQFLKQSNAIDLELYEFALSLARNKTLKAHQHSLAMGDNEPLESSRVVEDMDALRERVAQRLSLRGRLHDFSGVNALA